jgi:spoIIIJ-associated protein
VVYDAKIEAQEFVGIDRNDAIAQAVAFFETEEASLSMKVMSEGVNGLAGRTVVVAALKDRPSPEPRRRDDRPERGERGGRDRGDRGDRGGRGGGRERGGRDRGDRGDRGGRGGRERAEREDLAPPAEPSGPSVGTAQGSLGEIGQLVLGIVERLDIGPFEISESEDGSLLAFELKGEAALRLAGGDGRPVDALQLVANQAAAQADPDAKRVVLDVEGNAEARETFLTRLAERVVKRAADGGRAVALDPMNGRDRRIIHIAVREMDGVVTMSKGEGRYRQVVVVPEGAPEYEEAAEQSEAAAERE